MAMPSDEPRPITSNPFLEKTVEHWLASVNELGYLLPFCQLLLSEGFSICHVSRQNAFEQGKDIIALDRDGIPCAFQLKGGNITNARWRSEVWPEIEELINYQIIHPSVDPNKPHKSYLATNGELEDTVRLGIVNLNGGKWKDTPLKVITRGQLLRKFVELSGTFIPQEVSDYKTFLDLYFSDGRELVDEQKYSGFIKTILRLEEESLSKEERKRNIAASVLYTSYIISPFKKEANHISIAQTLSILSAYILAIVEHYDLDDRYWKDSFEIIWKELKTSSTDLQEEVKNDGFISMVNSMWDGEIGPYRRYLAVSYLLAFKVAQMIEGNPLWRDIATDEFFQKFRDALPVWGEASFLPRILVFFFIKKVNLTSDQMSLYGPLITALDALIKYNGRRSEGGLLSSYYGIKTAIKMSLGILNEPITESFARRSFMIKPIIDLLVRHGRREEVERHWREITYIAQERFIPGALWMHFLWRCDEGENRTEFPQQTQSWNALAEAAQKIDLDAIPKTIRRQPYFLPFFLLTFPHRVDNEYVKYLDDIMAKTETAPPARETATI
jgi:hypothetical protein